ncbi:eukaryotic translation initiation factor 1B, partial [Columba livia]
SFYSFLSLPLPSLSDPPPSLCCCYSSPRFLPSLPADTAEPETRPERTEPRPFLRCPSLSPQSRMSSIQNLQSFDPFADATKGDDLLPAGTEDYIHIRIQQRNGRKTLTTVQGIADDYDKKKLVKAFKKKFACNGTVIEHPEYGEVIQLQGDQRKNICQFLLEIGIVKEEQLKVHGF